ncbi:hypothetical protein [uncultured Desulfobacter sp.]|uniref:hypothetical protein n=1 Tax=uncultured Desulfobacter sp. TaxID=240139 RepID=UPI002AAB9335|nr:hypothetical protein [uncultured Desulfobacter sp.]
MKEKASRTILKNDLGKFGKGNLMGSCQREKVLTEHFRPSIDTGFGGGTRVQIPLLI